VRGRQSIAVGIAAGLALLFAAGAYAGGTNVTLCGFIHADSEHWTVDTILSTSEDGHPDVSCQTAEQTVIAIDGGRGSGVQHTRSAASGERELVYGKWTCTITSGWHGGAKSTFMARKVHGVATWVTCYDGVEVGGQDDAISYSHGKVAQL